MFLNLFYAPLAYFYTLRNKMHLERWERIHGRKLPDTEYYKNSACNFILVGPFFIILRMMLDTMNFTKRLFVDFKKVDDRIDYLTLSQFEMLEDILSELGGIHAKEDVLYKDFIKILQKKM